MRPICFALLLTIALVQSNALLAQEECATDQIHKHLLDTDPEYYSNWKKTDNEWAEYFSRSRSKQIITGVDTIYEIPVVVHVLHRGEAIGNINNPTSAAIQSMIDSANKRLSATMAGVPDSTIGGVYIPIKLVLAQTDPDCNRTNGINRVNASHIATYNTTGIDLNGFNTNDIEVKGLSIWPHNEYLNIWLVWAINGNAAGYANYPWDAASNRDGMVLDADYIKTSDITLVHELGHLLGLFHTFEGDGGGGSCPVDTNCVTVGDRVCDTEPDKRYASCTRTHNSCTGKPYGAIRQNYMNYVTCKRDRFTAGQKERVLFHLSTNRRGWVVSKKGDMPAVSMTKPASCMAKSTAASGLGGPTEVIFNSIHKVSNKYTNDSNKAYRDYTCVQRTDVVAGLSYDLTVSGDISSYHVTTYIDYDNNGIFDKNNEVVYNSTTLGTTNITIPATAVMNTPLRMRVLVDDDTSAQIDPCADLLNGQAEDYAVVVKRSSNVSGIHSAQEKSLIVYPNPAKGQLHVKCLADECTITIYDLLGEKVHSRKYINAENVIDISGLVNGVYIIKAVSGNNTTTIKFTKQ